MNLTPSTPLPEAARRIVDERLSVLEERSASLRDRKKVGADDVHQLRVATRRAAAAMSAFRCCLSAEHALDDPLKKLRRIRRAVGKVRSCDVSIAILEKEDESAELLEPSIKLLVKKLSKRRKRSMKRVQRVLSDTSPRKFRKLRTRFRAAVSETPENVTLALDAAAGLSVRAILEELNAAGAGPLQDAYQLHELRLVAKRLRYSLEVFRSCFDPSRFEAASELLVSLQDRLGEVNDLHELARFIRGVAKKVDEGRKADLTSIEAVYGARLSDSIERFEAWWSAHAAGALASSIEQLLRFSGDELWSPLAPEISAHARTVTA